MKKLLLGAVALFLMASCAGNGSSEKAREDSARIADSIAQIEKTKAEAEQARQDSIRQDSIKKAELEAFNIKLFVSPFKEEGFSGRGMELKTDKQISKALANLGFSENKSVRTRTEEICGTEETYKSTKYTYSKTIDDKTIIVEYEDELEIIFPNSELKDMFMKSAIKAGYKKNKNYSDGTGIFYQGPSDCYYRGSDIMVQGNKVFITYRSEC
ncbi:MAG: hypothetical protein J1E95_02340 [Muribaculaceae bacterium]|nr:hypothetical protein [Muribaculaceae bacterium]